jgi:hypothetical protein
MVTSNVGISQYAKDNDTYCGDLCAAWQTEEESTLLIIDGLGHGKPAAEASQKAYEYIQEHLQDTLEDMLKGCDDYISDTRGAAIAIAKINHLTQKIHYVAVGNTEGILYSRNDYIRLTSQWGIVGAGISNLIHETYPIDVGDYIILFTDGLDKIFDVRYYEASWRRLDVKTLADDIALRWSTRNDDVGVLVYQKEALS